MVGASCHSASNERAPVVAERSPEADSRAKRERFHFRPEQQVDLDGDGTKDFVIIEGGVRAVWSYRLYVARGSCGHFVGRVTSFDTVIGLADRHDGLRDIQTLTDECETLPNVHWCKSVFRFDGTQYRVAFQTKTKEPPGSY